MGEERLYENLGKGCLEKGMGVIHIFAQRIETNSVLRFFCTFYLFVCSLNFIQ